LTDWASHPEFDEFIIAHREAGNDFVAIAQEFRRAYGVPVTGDQVSGRLSRIRAGAVAKAPPSVEERFAAQVEKERTQAADRALAREMSTAIRAEARWQELLDTVKAELVRSVPPFIELLEFPVASGTAETMVVLIGDIHIGKLVTPSMVGNKFGYSQSIWEQRKQRLLDRILRLYVLHSQTAPIDRIKIYFLGDGVDGTDMRRGHKARVDIQTASEQTLLLVRMFEWLVKSLLQLHVPIEIDWNFGNHGRVGDFGVNLPADNWDYLAGAFLQEWVLDDYAPNVSMVVPTQKYTISQLGPLRVHASHGDAVRGGDGFSGLPINGLARALAKDTGLHKQIFDLYLTAHYHTPQDITTQAGRILMNGAWMDGDEYSVNQLKAASEPVQWAFGIHPDKGMTWQQRIWLAPSVRAATEVSR